MNSQVDRARSAAYQVLRAVRVESAYANLVLPAALDQWRLSGRDAAFATELAAGAIRLQGSYDPILDACLDHPGRLPAKVRDALRLGAHQLFSMRVPTHAAIATTVDLVKARVDRRFAGLTNAVLRRVSAHDLDTWLEQVAPDVEGDPIGHLAVRHSHPRWIVEAIRSALGDSELPALLAADNRPPDVVLVARPGRCRPAELPGEPTRFSTIGRVLPGGDPGSVPAVADGRAGVQDEGSQLVALAVAEAPIDGADARWLDLCAGPGGKATVLAGLAERVGGGLVAVERHHHRSRLVARSLAGTGALGVVTADGRRPAWRAAAFDRVLVDAPCSGLGALRRRPEARWRRSPDDLPGLIDLQRSLLSQALAAVRPGGLVAYATCSPVLAETREIVEWAQARHAVAIVPPSGSLGAVPDAAGPLPGTVQLWPHRHETDAMFVALLRRLT